MKPWCFKGLCESPVFQGALQTPGGHCLHIWKFYGVFVGQIITVILSKSCLSTYSVAGQKSFLSCPLSLATAVRECLRFRPEQRGEGGLVGMGLRFWRGLLPLVEAKGGLLVKNIDIVKRVRRPTFPIWPGPITSLESQGACISHFGQGLLPALHGPAAIHSNL